MKSILDIPDSSLLALFNLEDLVQIFSINSGIEHPNVICLPLYDEGGAQFESKFTSRESSLWQQYSIEKEVKNIRKKYPETKIYLSLNPTLPGIKASHLTCRDQFGGETTGTCISNPYVQKIILDIVLEACQRFEPDGIIFDMVDLHGQYAGGDGKPVAISCFCGYCKDSMREFKFNPDLLSQRISPLNLVLKATNSGIQPLTPTPNARFSPEQIVDLAMKEEFIHQDDEQSRNSAQIILDYIKARSRVTGNAIGEISQGIKSTYPEKRVGAIINDEEFDWVGGTDLQNLSGHLDEVWLEVQDLTSKTVPTNIEIIAYAADRARYRIAAFFEVVSDKQFLRGRVQTETIESIDNLIQNRFNALERAQNLNKIFTSTLEKMDFIGGFVGIAFERKFYQRIIQNVKEEISVIANDIQRKPTAVSKELIKQYIALLVKYREEGNELNRREIVGLAAQLNLID
jgi:hypothetical protein